ncbi:hypothetical protein GIB67_024832 [Kingdonia uniflora]|uniref:Autophagy-related protein n=1 Tax=Kingdonia uniflora TaxID=39325 RepID=A0A7J7NYN9_9MAGN|nr:hypothetical protein GIB67_024832 [Kingdonia uniflora]
MQSPSNVNVVNPEDGYADSSLLKDESLHILKAKEIGVAYILGHSYVKAKKHPHCCENCKHQLYSSKAALDDFFIQSAGSYGGIFSDHLGTAIAGFTARQAGTSVRLIPGNASNIKYLVPRDMSIGQFIHILSSRLHLAPGKALFVFVNNTLPQTASLVDSVYESSKDKDGFLYMCYSSEKTFG